MGQRRKSGQSGEEADGIQYLAGETLSLSLFLTNLGWFGLLGREGRVSGLSIGHTSAESARQSLRQVSRPDLSEDMGDWTESDWFPELRRRLTAYAAGEAVDFSDVDIEYPPQTAFQQQVIEATRRLEFGETISYGALADRAGSPRAARAVGSVMSHNRVPIIIPCHRVVGSSGKLGGFSAPQGIRLKEQMLALEAAGLQD